MALTTADRLEAIHRELQEQNQKLGSMCDIQGEQKNKLETIADIQNKMFYGLIAIIAATLGVRLTETDLGEELLYAASFLLLAAIAWSAILWVTRRKRWSMFYLLLLVPLCTMGMTVIVTGERLPGLAAAGCQLVMALALFGLAFNGDKFSK